LTVTVHHEELTLKELFVLKHKISRRFASSQNAFPRLMVIPVWWIFRLDWQLQKHNRHQTNSTTKFLLKN